MSDEFYSMHEISARLKTQDNAATQHPVFLVQQCARVYGFDHNYVDDRAWLDDEGNEAVAEDFIAFEESWEKAGIEPDGWSRTAYFDRWDFVQLFFTREAAQRYGERNAHNLKIWRIYVDSAHRNHEVQAVREYLLKV